MRDVVAKIIAFFQKHLTLVLVGLPLLATLVMLLLGVGIPDDQGTPVLINEISAPKDGAPEDYWIELYNNTDELVDVAGWSIRTLSETVTLDGVTAIGPGGYLIIPADPAAFAAANPILAAGAAVPSQPFHLSQGKGSIELINDKGRTVDATAWPPSTPPCTCSERPPA
ncbi:MAG: hypothetical protein KatS3mg057_0757 [Herpetosiphonaceae bacterium]|nr:MAG: hypothetical protein KatS3mg057_0757 [Herpetosiphonaceae bacterium]